MDGVLIRTVAGTDRRCKWPRLAPMFGSVPKLRIWERMLGLLQFRILHNDTSAERFGNRLQ
jgi:hypothetical protein